MSSSHRDGPEFNEPPTKQDPISQGEIDEARHALFMEEFGRITDYGPDMYAVLSALLISDLFKELPKTKALIENLLNKINGDA